MITSIIKRIYNQEGKLEALGLIKEKDGKISITIQVLEAEEKSSLVYLKYYKKMLDFSRLYYPSCEEIKTYVKEDSSIKEALEVFDLGFIKKENGEYCKQVNKKEPIPFLIQKNKIYVDETEIGSYEIIENEGSSRLSLKLDQQIKNREFIKNLYTTLYWIGIMRPNSKEIMVTIPYYKELERISLEQTGFILNRSSSKHGVLSYSKKLERK